MQLDEKYKVITESSICDAKASPPPALRPCGLCPPDGAFCSAGIYGYPGKLPGKLLPGRSDRAEQNDIVTAPTVAADSFGATVEPMACIREVIV